MFVISVTKLCIHNFKDYQREEEFIIGMPK